MLKFENLNKFVFDGVGAYQIPAIYPVEYQNNTKWVGFNYARSAKEKAGSSVHFFLDDYQFSSVWSQPDKYIERFRAFDYILSPDFSLYTDTPKAIQIYNHYKKHWIGAYMQMSGVNVIPTISWSDKDSFDWCFDGEPKNSVVAISTVGTQNSKTAKEMFLNGYNEMVRRLKPTTILCYGKIPDEIKNDVVFIGNFYDEMVERRKAKWAEEERVAAEAGQVLDCPKALQRH